MRSQMGPRLRGDDECCALRSQVTTHTHNSLLTAHNSQSALKYTTVSQYAPSGINA